MERQGVSLDIVRSHSKSSQDLKKSAPIFYYGMVASVSWNRATVIYFCSPEVNMTIKIREETILEPVVKPLYDTLFKGQCGIFQQDSAPAHKSKHCQE